MNAAISNSRPRDDKGHFVPMDCPNPLCGAGRLQSEAYGIWYCDGLADPNDNSKELEECRFCHIDGQPYSTEI